MAFGILAGSAALAQEECAKITNPEDRLNCYDTAFKTVEPPKKSGDWVVRQDTSKLDDTKTVVLMVESDQPIRKRFGGTESGTLLIRCQENTTSLFFTWAGNFMSDLQGRGRVDYRIDDTPASRINTDVSTDNTALGLWSGGTAIPFIKRLIGANTLYVRATPFSDSPVEMTFNISGLDQAIIPLKDACKW